MKAVTFASFALALILASPGDANDIRDISSRNSSRNLFAPPAPHLDRAHVKRGDSGGDVSILQKALNNHGEHLKIDGVFGRRTEKAVKDFQARSGLETTGQVDSGTWSALRNPLLESETDKQAVSEVKAQATEIASQIASLNS